MKKDLKKDLKIIFGVVAAVALSLSLSGARTGAEAAVTVKARDAVRLEVTATCNPDAMVFRVRNAGPAWPKTSRFAIYDLAGDKPELLSKRRFRLKQGQHASFRIKHKSSNAHVGLWVEPGWYTREFLYDAEVDCDANKN